MKFSCLFFLSFSAVLSFFSSLQIIVDVLVAAPLDRSVELAADKADVFCLSRPFCDLLKEALHATGSILTLQKKQWNGIRS